MKKLLTLALLTLALTTSGTALATIDWAGNVWPASTANVVPSAPVDVFAQVYKSGVTDSVGQGADLSAVLNYTFDFVTFVSVPMTYNGDIGNNDEYTGQIPQAALAGESIVYHEIVFTDATDAGTFNIPFVEYNIVDVLPNDVEVGFRLCLSGAITSGDVCVIGSDPALGSWTTGVTMNDDGGGLYGITVIIPAGSSPTFEYKYRKDGCTTWESVANRVVTLPVDGTTFYPIPDADSWENLPLGCGLGDVLTEDKEICFQVCLSGTATSGDVCVVGNIAELDNWGTGTLTVEVATDLYQACIVLSAGSPIPNNIEYKFKKDGCSTWESVANRFLTIDNTSPATQTVTHAWDDGPNACAPVGAETTTWGAVKGMYR